ncbi:MAG: glycoside hydrolase [Acidobacteria bacterium]|nr:glycoside hydrolase [Acidobacteriota bacterium]
MLRAFLAASLGVATLCVSALPAQDNASKIDASAYRDLRYRLIGPFRASRTVAGVGIPTQPNEFFAGVHTGGVWKTDDYGRTWRPIFDRAPTGSIGDIGVSWSNPDILYVGTGEGLHRPDLGVGDGIFKSTDGGQSWKHVGLGDVQQVGRLVVHPTNPNIVFVAGLGHPYGPNAERGIFRTTNGGATWEKVLYVNENTGGVQVEFDPKNPNVVYGSLWEHREGPWENASFSGPNSGLYKSTDGGTTWTQLKDGLPARAGGVGRICLGISPSDPERLYAAVMGQGRGAEGFYRSNDGGKSWTLVNTDGRLGLDVRVHPKNPDVIFVGNIAAYRSDDAGKTWTSIKGAPGGDDYQRIWINPLQPDIMLFTADQGAVVTVNGGRTWSSWYNQPTAQMYHVTTDNQFPYWVYGGQQESGAIGIASRGNGGQISFRDWIGVGVDEYAYIAPDPVDTNIIYGGRVMRFDRTTGQAQNVAPEALRSGKYRMLRTMPLLFHPADPKALFFATNVLWKTRNGGDTWDIISPDLSREQPDVPESIGVYRTPEMQTMARRGVIYAVSPSVRDVNVIWAGTDDGLVHVTRDAGKTWTNVTPPELRAWDKVSQIDAGHFDANTAYIAINAIRRDDMRPHIYRTHDGGRTWTRIVHGINPMGPVNVVREDRQTRGLLFAGTEREVVFSADDGENWQPLRLNMPATSIRDLVIKEDDLVIGTHGRSIWIMDNVGPLRQLAAAAAATGAFLFTPPRATRVRSNMFSDTPLPPEEPTGQNPPDGAILDYYLPRGAKKVTLEIVGAYDELIRRYSSTDEPERIDPNTLPYPTYWIRPHQALGTSAGHHRFVWDLRYAPPRGTRRTHAIAAIYRNTPSGPTGPFVHPGSYSVRLTVDGAVRQRRLEVRLDPRVTIAPEDLRSQTDASLACYRAYEELQEIRDAIDARSPDARKPLMALRGNGEPGDQDVLYGSITAVSAEQETIVGLQQKFLYMLTLLQGADARPTPQSLAAVAELQKTLAALKVRWARSR